MPARLPGKPCPVVLQGLWPADQVDLNRSAYRVAPDGPTRLPVFAYNFSERPLTGRWRVRAPAGWQVTGPSRTLRLQPGARERFELRVEPAERAGAAPATVRLEADFGETGVAVLALRVVRLDGKKS